MTKSSLIKTQTAQFKNFAVLILVNTTKYFKAIYDRIVAKGKSEKLALIAIYNKLLKQAFAIVKSGLIYDGSCRSILVKN